jgi:NADPH:quinone reductase-like Zn-dependent oxidoreductase
MQAIRLTAYGDAVAGLALHDVPEPPPPGPGEVLVQVRYAPINVNDLMVALGIYAWKPALPEILGNEGAGVVVATGAGVAGLAPGTPVVLPFMARSWRARLVVPAAELTALPPDADLQQAAMATINAVTAAMLLDDYVDLAAGDAIAFNAATSGLGHWLAGLAARRGLRSIGLVRRSEDAVRVRAAGCDVVLVDGAPVTAALRDLRVRLALDGVGGASAGRLADLLATDGQLVAYGAASHRPMEISAQHLIFKRLGVHGFFEGHPNNAVRIRGVLAGLTGLLRPGGIRQPVAAVYAAADIQAAAAHAARGTKVLLRF